jgi:DNA modification methylase
MESVGFGVRNMIVWDKGTPGMGVGWRSQHEICMMASRSAQKFSPHKAQGNVIKCARTGNINHPTEKPVELIAKIIDVTDFAEEIYDPFAGSGTTLIACEQLQRKCYAMELDPAYVDVIINRWEDMTGQKAELIQGAD